jgi:hypothetical protein
MKLIFLLLLVSFNVFAKNTQVKREPEIVKLSGKLELQTFPGRPNYESIKNGDEVERHFYLSLDSPIDVLKDPNDRDDEPVYNVKILQLVISNDNDWKLLRKIGVNGKTTIQGTLFKRFTGHHHSRVLFEVQKIHK